MQIAELKQQIMLTDGILGIFAIPSSHLERDDNEHADRNDDHSDNDHRLKDLLLHEAITVSHGASGYSSADASGASLNPLESG